MERLLTTRRSTASSSASITGDRDERCTAGPTGSLKSRSLGADEQWSGALASAPDAWRSSIRAVMEPLEEIASLTWQLGEVAERLPALVAAARAQGKTWSQVGTAHGISRQAAQQRYGPGQ